VAKIKKKLEKAKMPEKITNCVAFYGKEEIVNVYMDYIANSYFKTTYKKIHIDCSESNEEFLLNNLVSVDLFAPNRCLIIQNMTARHKEVFCHAMQTIAKTPNLLCLIKYDEASTDLLFQTLKKTNLTYDCNIPIDYYGKVDYERLRKLQAHVESLFNGVLFKDNGAIEQIIYGCGYNLAMITQESHKIKAYYSGVPITEQELQLIMADNASTNIFKLVESMENNVPKETFRILSMLINNYGLDFAELCGFIINKLRLLCHVAEYCENGYSYDDIILSQMKLDANELYGEDNGIITYHPFVINMASKTAKRIGKDRLFELYDMFYLVYMNTRSLKNSQKVLFVDFLLKYFYNKGIY
jgi:DNA polymerase III delta subunit